MNWAVDPGGVDLRRSTNGFGIQAAPVEKTEEVDQKRCRNRGLALRGSLQASNLARRVKSVACPVIADRTGPLDNFVTPFKVSKEYGVNRESDEFSRAATVIGGGSLIAATLLFSAVFVVLARSFGYPDVLDLPAAEVLPRLLALGPGGRAVWVLYGLIPLLLLPTAMGVYAPATMPRRWRPGRP